MCRSDKQKRNIGKQAGFSEDQRGATVVELALVFPVFFMIILGIFETGRAIQTWNEVHHSLGRAVRLLNVDATTPPDDIVTAMRSYLTSVKADTLSVAAETVTISGIEHIRISVGFPFDITLPFTDISTMQINVNRTAPVLSATK